MIRLADRRLASLSRRQFGAFSRRQARDCGLLPETIRRRVQSGRYIRLLPHVFAEAACPDAWELRAMASLLEVGGQVGLARGSAARLHALPVPPAFGRNLHLLVGDRTFPGLDSITVHRSRTLDARDLVRIGPLTATQPTRTIVDLAGDVGPPALRRLVADGVRRGLTTEAELRTEAKRLGRVRGKRHLLRLVDELSPLDADCRSELETRFLHLMIRAGLPPTAMNHPVRDVLGRRRYIDAVYLPEGMPIELDSKRAHGSGLDQADDRRRENMIQLGGQWRPFLRFDWVDVTQRRRYVVTTVSDALVAARLAA